MKKINFFPFERNRYYYGKHLTVNDFVLEQEYMNNKRRFINRYLHGTGVVCGLNVIAIDEKTISVEAGVGIDFAGREIVVDTPIIKKLSSIEGFDTSKEDDYFYLCIDYNEQEAQPVYSIAGKSSSNQSLECNSYIENYSLYLTSKEPNTEVNTTTPYYVSNKTIYKGSQYTIRQRVSLFCKSNGTLKLEVIVDKNSTFESNISFKYPIKLTCLTHNQADILNVEFDESKHKKSKSYTLSYTLNVANVKDDYALIESMGSLQISKDGVMVHSLDTPFSIKVKVVAGDLEHQVLKEYYNKSMESILKYNSYQYSIYLAKIYLVRAKNTYLIDSIEPMPFNQYVYSGQTANIMNELLLQRLDTVNSDSLNVGNIQSVKTIKNDAITDSNYMVSSGEEVIDLGIGGKFGQVFQSKSIAHGLGLGAVSITLGCATDVSESSSIVYGSAEVFEGLSVKCETAVKLDTTTGQFVIGIRLLDNTTTNKVKIHWTAIKVKELEDETHNRRIYIQPSMVELSVMQTCYFTATFENINDKGVVWSVNGSNSGTINSNGMYTAPNTAGIYEVVAQSEAYPEVKTSVYVIVGDLS